MLNLDAILASHELRQERRRLRHPGAMDLKMRWRGLLVQRSLHVVPGERILEIGAGSGAWTEVLSKLLRAENPVTGAVFSPELLRQASARASRNLDFIDARQLDDLPPGSFDYIIGSSVLWHAQVSPMLTRLRGFLKPGGRVLFFDSNLRFPGRGAASLLTREFHASTEDVRHLFSHQGFTHVDIVPYDLLPIGLGPQALRLLQAKVLLFEHAPVVKRFTTSMYVTARLPGPPRTNLPDMAEHPSLAGAVSVVVPCRNEAPNLPRLVERLVSCYGAYLHEIIIVNDNSTDNTAGIAAQLRAAEPRVRLINRNPPGGVGRALADGYRAATGRYILSIDCDFVEIIAEFRALFDAIAQGYDGAIGSRFSKDSVLLNYPFTKMICNRALHFLVKLFLRDVRDVSNNLKLYKAEVLQSLKVESPHFSANLETGLKPLLAGYRVKEVPCSWMDRTVDMGTSSFHLRRVGLDYARTLYRIWRTDRSQRSAWFSLPVNPSVREALPQPQLSPLERSEEARPLAG